MNRLEIAPAATLGREEDKEDYGWREADDGQLLSVGDQPSDVPTHAAWDSPPIRMLRDDTSGRHELRRRFVATTRDRHVLPAR